MAKNSRKNENPTVENKIRNERRLGMPFLCIHERGGKQIIARKEANKKGVIIWLMAFKPPIIITTAARPTRHSQEREIVIVAVIDRALGLWKRKGKGTTCSCLPRGRWAAVPDIGGA